MNPSGARIVDVTICLCGRLAELIIGSQENPLMYIDVYFRILHAYTIIYSIYLNIGFPILGGLAPPILFCGAVCNPYLLDPKLLL